MGARKAKKAAAPKIGTGDYVLCGGSPASYPSGWYLGEVLWAGPGDLLIERSTLNGQTWRETVAVSHIRAVGTIDELVTARCWASEAVRDLTGAINEAEQALEKARAALWARLDEMAALGVSVIPPDFDRINREGEEIRTVVGQADDEALTLRELERA